MQLKYKRDDKLVCKAYDTLVSVGFMSNSVVHVLVTLKEMPTARDAIGTEILRQHFKLRPVWGKSLGLLTQIR